MTPLPTARPALPLAGLALAVLAVHAALLNAPLVYDDVVFILTDPRVAGPWPGWAAFFSTPPNSPEAYEPLLTLLHRLLYAFAGETPWPYRLSSLLLHWANAALLFSVLSRRLARPALAFWGALLFAVFPAHAEVLAVSTFKKHALVLLCGLSTVELLDREPRPGRAATAACWALCAAALLVKETALIIPGLAALHELAAGPLGRPAARRRPLYAGYAVLVLAYAGLRAAFPRPLPPPIAGSWALHLLTSALLVFWYLPRLALPLNLCVEHSFSEPLDSWAAVAAAGAGAAAGLALLAWALRRLWRRDRAAGFGAAWAALGLAPFLNLVPFTNYSLVADRYLYLASPGFVLAALRGLDRASRGRRGAAWVLAGLAAAALAYGGLSLRRAALFGDPIELWSRTAACAPRNPRAHAALGAALLRVRAYPEAARSLETALSLHPEFAEAVGHLAQAYAALGRRREAKALALRRLALKPDAGAWHNLGLLQLDAGDLAAARVSLERAARLKPSPDADLSLAACAQAQGRAEEAKAYFVGAGREPALRPMALRGLGDLAVAAGRRAEAARLYEASLALDPLQAGAASALARLYARLGRAAEAGPLYDRLLAAVDASAADLRRADPARYGAMLRRAESLRGELLAGRRRLVPVVK